MPRSRHFCPAIALCLGAAAAAQPTLTPSWVYQHGTKSADTVAALLPIPSGGAYIGGQIFGGNNPWNLNDAFLAKVDANGDEVWFQPFGGTASIINGLARDSAGGFYVGGQARTGLGQYAFTHWHAFLARYTSGGDVLWLVPIGPTVGTGAIDVAPDGAGGAYILGSTHGNLAGTHQGNGDGWIARFDAAGNQLWLRQFGSYGMDRPRALASAGSGGAGGVYITGTATGDYGGALSWGTGIFITRYDREGNELWVRKFATSGGDEVGGAAPDGAGGVYIVGTVLGPLTRPVQGPTDAFIARYNPSGNQVWIHQYGGIEQDRFYGVAADGAGGAWVSGRRYNPDPNNHTLDVALAGFTPLGELAWAGHLGEKDETPFIAAAPGGGAYIAGSTYYGLAGPTAGGTDLFLAHLPPCYANCNRANTIPMLNVLDFVCFLQRFAAGDPWANCDQSTTPPVLNTADFSCFLQHFAQGCP